MCTDFFFFFVSFVYSKIPATNNEPQELFLHVAFPLSALPAAKQLKISYPCHYLARHFTPAGHSV